ncbi:MAG: hypothetical protein WDZ38_06530, partial [Balneolaceae bacterium]
LIQNQNNAGRGISGLKWWGIDRQKAEGRRQKAEGKRQKAKGRRQKAEGKRVIYVEKRSGSKGTFDQFDCFYNQLFY